eukprot:TRINITY_DN326_c1_g3_i1.p1 TRINITY_DN326_c1_g3~~TRINITY_DN326_c1_g3_i1.p1  ORF type:complete len:263 (+),score=49.37 TRINITY_DN326_c1_g3_i1:73-861(+)
MPSPVRGMPSLAGKVVAVTGASGGIGEVIVKTMVKYGCIVRGVDIDKASGKMGQMQKEYGKKTFTYVTANLLDADECSSIATKVGDVDMLVNSAGLAKISPLMEQTAQDWDLTMGLNAKAVFLVSQAFARQWIEAKKAGSIVNISSQASNAPLPGHTTYCASKACVDMITRILAMELGPHGIRVNAVNPTVVLTDMGRANWSDPKVAGPMLSSIPLNRFAEPDEVSEAIAWLLTDAAGMVNGHLLPIDGGFLACRSNLMSKV